MRKKNLFKAPFYDLLFLPLLFFILAPEGVEDIVMCFLTINYLVTAPQPLLRSPGAWCRLHIFITYACCLSKINKYKYLFLIKYMLWICAWAQERIKPRKHIWYNAYTYPFCCWRRKTTTLNERKWKTNVYLFIYQTNACPFYISNIFYLVLQDISGLFITIINSPHICQSKIYDINYTISDAFHIHYNGAYFTT